MAARRGKTQARRNSGNGTPGWVWLIAGVAIAAVVFLAAPGLFKKDGDGFLRVGGPRANPDAQPAPVADADVDAAPELPKPAATAAGSTKPDAKKDAQTQYDFYTLLPGKEVQMSDAELAASARAEANRKARAPQAAATPATATAATATAPASTAALANPTPLPETAAASAPASTAATSAKPSAAATAPAATAVAAAPDNTRYILQAGSFGASGDAESTKAKLAMLGLSARVESAQISGKTVYRVRMGPYGTASELAEAKQKLTGSGLPAIAIKAQ
ncbi:SPOR domain-containing protein [Xanthomonas sp. NCPPB 2654]|uniref:SPOR domain-containing protein n=1 Tax=unclassified Xanthomonas TaxID=2643310 RepID=UPI0021DFDB73|nr:MULTISPECIES: SPOR domain-containing protein [unclassified Xanthomonas]MDL5364376.1 SPOR domain-containing protein [Xanthomonas sp. NCPPB 2654]UYC20331.1 SPOR domain-containing protein [Xanthomonas sp. CFBP 8443]